MDKYIFFNKNNEQLNLKLIFSFYVPTIQKTYVAVDNQNKIFNNFSNYNNLDVLEISAFSGNVMKLSNIPEKEWPEVKNFMYDNIFAKIRTAPK